MKRLILMALFLSGCAPTLSGSVRSATNEYFHTWRDLPSISDPIEIQLNLTVEIIPDQKTKACGHAWSNGKEQRIKVIGRWYNGEIVPDQMGIGHEILHLLNWVNPKIGNPDKYK